MKSLWKVLGILVLSVVITISVTYCTNGGRLTEKFLDLSLLNDENPIRREQNIEDCTTATVKVISLKNFDSYGVSAEFEENPDVQVNVYISKKDAVKIDVGDIITVKGRINYMPPRWYSNRHFIVIGNSIATFPFALEAKLVNISTSNDERVST